VHLYRVVEFLGRVHKAVVVTKNMKYLIWFFLSIVAFFLVSLVASVSYTAVIFVNDYINGDRIIDFWGACATIFISNLFALIHLPLMCVMLSWRANKNSFRYKCNTVGLYFGFVSFVMSFVLLQFGFYFVHNTALLAFCNGMLSVPIGFYLCRKFKI
jgi:hypothetical protein